MSMGEVPIPGNQDERRVPPSEKSKVVVETFRGRAQDFHLMPVPTDSGLNDSPARVWWFEPTADALVLGSAQDRSIVDLDACTNRGVDVVERRSGGGLVLVTTNGTLWLDVVVPVGHRLWERDVTRSAFWLGEVWMEALEEVGVVSLVQHRASLVRTTMSDAICFAGRGPGEVFDVHGSKVVGISQRRTRHHARFQCVVSLEWEPIRLVELLEASVRDRTLAEYSTVATAGSSITVDRPHLIETMTKCLDERLR